jgi:signal transduction histidine kinase
MENFFKKLWNLILKNPPILSSLALIIIVPGVILSLVFSTIHQFEKNLVLALGNNFANTHELLTFLVREDIEKSNFDSLQKKIENVKEIQDKNLAQAQPAISEIKILLPKDKTGEKFQIIASTNRSEIGKEIIPNEMDPREKIYTIAWNTKEGILFPDVSQALKKQVPCKVYRPIINANGQKIALNVITFSLEKVATLISTRTQASYLASFGGIVFVLLLLVQHTRLFGYVDLARRLKELNEAKDSFLNMAVHELRSPIVAIRGYLEFFKKAVFDRLSLQEKDDLERIEISTKRLNELIDDMLQVTRIEQGRLSFEPEIFSPKNIIEETVKEFQGKAQAKNLKLLLEERGDGFIRANPNRLREIVVNLVDNAIKYTKKGYVKVRVDVDKIRKKYFLFVEDTGIGMSGEAQKRLFEKFYRIQTKETAEIPGTGLGLWIVKNITEKMGGKIFVESIEGKGSKFTVVFPLVEKESK